MALSGTINGSVTLNSSYYTFYVVWSGTQSISGNYTDVTATSYWGWKNDWAAFDTVSERSASITINGSTSSISKRFNCNPRPSGGVYSIQTSTVRVNHDTDGTKSITISARANGCAGDYGPSDYASSAYDCTASATVTLDTIPRGATLNTASAFNDTGNPTITYSNPAGNAVTSLKVKIDNLSYRDVSKTGNSYTFSLSSAEMNTLRNSVSSTSTSKTVTFTLQTVIGGSTLTSTATSTFSLTSGTCGPTISSVTFSPNTPSPASGVYVQSKSTASCSISASAKYGASISSYSTTLNGNTYTGSSFTSSTLTSSGTLTATITVTDSRGFTATTTRSITVLAYTKPSIIPISGETTVQAYRSNSSGTASDTGTYVWVKARSSYSAVGSNTATLQTRSKAESGSWSGWTTRTSPFNGNIGSSFSATTAYTIEIRITDGFNETSTIAFNIPTSRVTLHLGANGRSMGIGRYADTSQNDSLKVAWSLMGEAKYNTMNYLPYSWDAVGENGSTGYARIATITLTGASSDGVIQFAVSRRLDDYPVNLYVLFGSESDATLKSFLYDIKPYSSGSSQYFSAFIKKTDTRTWDVYVLKVGSNDHISVSCIVSPYMQGKASITFTDLLQSSVLSGATVASRIGGGRIYYGTSSTAAATVAKVATCPNMPLPLETGTTICINFSNANTGAVADLTLNVNSQGAKGIRMVRNGSIANLPTASALVANAPLLFTYSGTYWFLDNYDYNTNTVPVDYITEQGTSGIWQYRKWNSGVSECWGKTSRTIPAGESGWTRWPDDSTGDYTAIEGLVTNSVTYPSGLFIATPVFECTLSATGGVWLETSSEGSATGTPTIYAVRPAWWASQFPSWAITANANMRAIGKWK